jgi:CheY-like chemotaxis protein
MTLLVADDDQNYRSLLSEILALQGHLVYTAADGAEAYQIVQTEEIQMVVSDIRMPRVDGYELHKLLRRDLRHCLLPFVYYSGYMDSSAQHVIQDPEIDFFLPKGESIACLSQLISSEAAKQAGKSSSPFTSDEKMRRGTDGLFPLVDF